MLWKKLSSGLEGIIPSPSVDSLILSPEPISNTYTNGQEFGFSWTSSNSVGVSWEVYDFIGNQQQPTPIYSGTGNINGSVSNIFAPNTGNFMTVDVAAEGFPGADPLFVGVSRLVFLEAATPTDPYFANVVLLLHGDGANGGTTFTDSSSYNKSPDIITNVTTSNEQTLFGQNTIKSINGQFGAGSELTYGVSADFAGSDNFTLEYWIYIGSQVSQPYFMAKDATVYFTYSGGSLQETNWGGSSGALVSPNSWNYIAISRNGVGSNNFNFYLNGNRTEQLSVITQYTNPAAFGITNVPTRNDLESFNGYLAEIRYTQGVGRYTTATIPVPSAPWPNS